MCLIIHVFFYILSYFLNFPLINNEICHEFGFVYVYRHIYRKWVLLVGSKCRKHRYSYGLTNTSSRKVFHDIFSYSGVKKSIMGRSSVGKLDE